MIEESDLGVDRNKERSAWDRETCWSACGEVCDVDEEDEEEEVRRRL